MPLLVLALAACASGGGGPAAGGAPASGANEGAEGTPATDTPPLTSTSVPGSRVSADLRAANTYRLYVANESSDLVSRVAFTPGVGAEVEKQIPVGIMPGDNDGAHGIAVDPSGRFWYVTIAHGTPYGSVWKFAAGPDTLVGRADLGLFPATMGITPDGQFLLAVNFNLHGDMVPSDVSVVYTPTMTEMTRVETCLMPHGSRVNASGTKQYSACMHSDQLVEIDLTTFEITHRYSLAPGHERSLDVADQGMMHMPMEGEGMRDQGTMGHEGAAREHAAMGQEGAAREHAAMLHEGGAGEHTAMGNAPEAVCSPTWAEPAMGPRADRFVYVACNKNQEVVEVDVETWQVTRRFPTGRAPYNLEVTRDGTRLVATLKGDQAVAVFDLESGRELGRLATTEPITHGVVASPDGRYAFVSNESVGSVLGTLDVFDLRTLERVASVALRHQSGGIDFWTMAPAGGAPSNPRESR